MCAKRWGKEAGKETYSFQNHSKINAKEVIVVKKEANSVSYAQLGVIKLARKDSEVCTFDQFRQGPKKMKKEHSSDHSREENDKPDLAEQDAMDAKSDFWKISLSMCLNKLMSLKKAHFQFLLKYVDVVRRTLHWTCCRNTELMIIGTLMVIGNYQDRGPVSPNSRAPPQRYVWSGED